nr:MAG TPA: hypothetical protein [Caudoviricetes sp.]
MVILFFSVILETNSRYASSDNEVYVSRTNYLGVFW